MKAQETKQWYKKWWVWLIIALVIIGAIGSLNKKNTPTQTSQTPAQESTDKVQPELATNETPVAPVDDHLPETQKKLISLVDENKAKYSAASTDLQKSDIIRTRDTQICSAVGTQFNDWVGTVKEVGANNQGKAHLSVDLSPSVKISTWNNALSDYSDNTLIPQGSELYNELVKMNKGAKVSVSGAFIASDSSCIRATNVTKTFTALDPDYLVRFTSVKAK